MSGRRLPSARVVRAAVLGAGLAVCVAAVTLVVFALSTRLGHSTPGGATWLVATLVLACLVPVLRPPVERLADRIAFGPDGDPHAVLERFVQRAADALAVDDVLPDLARTASVATRGSGSQVRLWLPDGAELVEVWPPNRGSASRTDLAIEHDGAPVGRLGVDLAPGELSTVERELLGALTGPAGVAMSSVRLTYELRERLEQAMTQAEQLRQSRQRLLDARELQRRRFTAEVDARVLSRLAGADTALADAAIGPDGLSAAATEAMVALEELRDLAAGVFPPALAERGLAQTLDTHLGRTCPGTRVDLDEADDRLPETVARAAYFATVALADQLGGERVRLVTTRIRPNLLEIHVAATCAPDTDTLLLVEDRMAAIGGTLVVTDGDHGWAAALRLPFATVPASRTPDPGDPQ